MTDEKPGPEKATYPERTCREGVFNDHGMAYSCELVELHPGPCCSFSVRSQIERRTAWETLNPDWRDNIGKHDILS